jgi:hypothetical protein
MKHDHRNGQFAIVEVGRRSVDDVEIDHRANGASAADSVKP